MMLGIICLFVTVAEAVVFSALSVGIDAVTEKCIEKMK